MKKITFSIKAIIGIAFLCPFLFPAYSVADTCYVPSSSRSSPASISCTSCPQVGYKEGKKIFGKYPSGKECISNCKNVACAGDGIPVATTTGCCCQAAP